jgi:methylmalonyl-CoA mutase C-terminal domain/subunit
LLLGGWFEPLENPYYLTFKQIQKLKGKIKKGSTGFEVIYSGLHQTPRQIVRTAIQEDVKAIGVSILSGAHLEYFQEIISELKEQKLENVLVFGGGVIPLKDIDLLREMGIGRIFTPGSSLDEIPLWLREKLSQ